MNELRLNPVEVAISFKKLDLSPDTGSYVSKSPEGKIHACGLGAVYAANNFNNNREFDEFIHNQKTAHYKIISDWLNERYGCDYSAGFANGFDGYSLDLSKFDFKDLKRFDQGFQDGKETRYLVFDQKVTNMKIYISGPMTGYKEKNFPAFFEAEKKLNSNWSVVNPAGLDHTKDKEWHEFMRTDIKALMDCDAIYMLNGWRESKGACIERYMAMALDMIVIYQ